MRYEKIVVCNLIDQNKLSPICYLAFGNGLDQQDNKWYI